MESISKETYIRRRAQLKRDMGSGLLLFLGNDEVGMNYADNTYRFRQDSTFQYFFGLDYAGLAAVIDVDNDAEIVFGNELTIDDIVWTGTQPTLREKAATVGIALTRPMSELKNYIVKAQRKGQQTCKHALHDMSPLSMFFIYLAALCFLPSGGENTTDRCIFWLFLPLRGRKMPETK